jgi:hypothetical protein
MKVDCKRLEDSTAVFSEAMGCPVGPSLKPFGLRWGVGFLGSGVTSPRLIARLSCCSAFFLLVDVGFRRAGI